MTYYYLLFVFCVIVYYETNITNSLNVLLHKCNIEIKLNREFVLVFFLGWLVEFANPLSLWLVTFQKIYLCFDIFHRKVINVQSKTCN